jgi:hypothetical protein
MFGAAYRRCDSVFLFSSFHWLETSRRAATLLAGPQDTPHFGGEFPL